MGFVPATELK